MTSTAAELVERVHRIARQRAERGTLAPPPPESTAATSPTTAASASAPRSRPRLPKRDTTPAVDGIGEVALMLAEILQDPGGLRFYARMVQAMEEGRLLPDHPRDYVRRLVLAKARELNRLRVPHGPVQKPGAAFNAWVRRLPCDDVVTVDVSSREN